MKKRLFQLIAATFTAMALLVSPAFSTPVYAANEPGFGGGRCEGQFFTFPAWHNGLVKDADCRIKITSLNAIWVIGFNILNIGIQVAAYTAAFIMFFMIFKMLTARGDPGKISSAGLGIRNAIIGLVIALISVAIVQFVTTSIAGSA